MSNIISQLACKIELLVIFTILLVAHSIALATEECRSPVRSCNLSDAHERDIHCGTLLQRAEQATARRPAKT